MSEVADSMKAYGVAGHRHLPEIGQTLSRIADEAVAITFVPHLTPMIRGIHATLYASLRKPVDDLQAVYEARYADEPFVDVMPAGEPPGNTFGTRFEYLPHRRTSGRLGTNRVVVLSVTRQSGQGCSRARPCRT